MSKILFGIWSLPIARLLEPVMAHLTDSGFECVPTTLRLDAHEFLISCGYEVINVAPRSGQAVSQELINRYQAHYEKKVNEIVLSHGKTPEWQLVDVLKTVQNTRDALEAFSEGTVVAVVLWNGNLSFQKEMAFFARVNDLPIIYMERGHFPGTMIVDEYELDEESEFRTLIWPFIEATKEPQIQSAGRQYREKLISGRGTLERQKQSLPIDWKGFCTQLGIASDKKVVFVPLQVPIDTNMIFRTFDIRCNEELVAAVLEATNDMKDVEVAIKFHPGDKWTDREGFLKGYPRVRCITDLHVHDAIGHSNLVVTLNSQVCIEALLYSKPVITCGKSHFGGLVNSYHEKARYTLLQSIREALENPIFPEEYAVDRFVYALKENYLVDEPMKAANRIKLKIEQNLPQCEVSTKLRRKRIGVATALLDNPDNPTFWLRIEHIRRALEKYGEVSYLTPENMGSQPWDMVFICHRFEFGKIQAIIHKIGCLIYDVNDEIFNNPRYGEDAKRFAEIADAVIFSTKYLQERYMHLSKRSYVLPDGFDEPPQAFHGGEKNCVVWTGYKNNLIYVEEISEGLSMAQKHLGNKFKLLTSSHNDRGEDNRVFSKGLHDLEFEFQEWKRESYYHDLAKADIGIAPLSLNSFCMSKTANKLLTYQAAGLCVIAHAGIPSYEDYIQHGENGLLAFTPEDYYRAIKYLCENPDAKERIRDGGRKSLEKYSDFMITNIIDKIMEEAITISSVRQYLINSR